MEPNWQRQRKDIVSKPIYVTRPLLPDRKELEPLLAEIWDSHILTNYGPLHTRLEDALKHYLDVPQISLCSSGHMALESVLRRMELDGEVITTPFTFVSTTNALIRCGLKPIFCDIRMEDYTLDPDRIEEKITEKTCAILPVHVYGQLCRMDEIEAIADRYGIPVLYDAAHIFGVRWDAGVPLLRGAASVLSFHATKVFHTIEGGAVVTRDATLNRRLELDHNHGICGPEDSLLPGGNAKMNEFQAAMGLCNLNHVEQEIANRAAVCALYTELLADVAGLKLLREQPGVRSNHGYFPVVFLAKENPRDRVFLRLAQNGYYARKYFYPLTCDMTGVRAVCGGDVGPIDTARYVSQRVLCLPLYGDLEPRHVETICRIIRRELQGR